MGPVVRLGRETLVAIAGGLIILVGRFSLALSLAISRVDATGRLPGVTRVRRTQLRAHFPRPRISVVKMRLGVAIRQPQALAA